MEIKKYQDENLPMRHLTLFIRKRNSIEQYKVRRHDKINII